MDRVFKRTIPALILLAASGITQADNRDASRRGILMGEPLNASSPFEITLRSTEVGSTAVLMTSIGLGPHFIASGVPFQLDIGAVPLTTGSIGTDGKMVYSATAPALAGTTFYLQALISGSMGETIVSNLVTAVVDATDTVAFTDRSSALPFPHATTFGGDVDTADVDGDGLQDIAVSHGNGVLLSMNRGNGRYREQSTWRLRDLYQVDRFQTVSGGASNNGPRPVSVIEFGDIDNDGDMDLFVGGGEGTDIPVTNKLLENVGGTFRLIKGFPGGRGLCTDAKFGDFDNDGDLDLLLANGQDSSHSSEDPDPDALLINQGGLQGGKLGRFFEDELFRTAPFNSSVTSTTGIAVGDIDDDGDLDIFLCTNDFAGSGSPNLLLRNNGLLSFTDISSTNLLAVDSDDNCADAELADLDADGDLDLILAQTLFSAGGATLYLNDGTGFFGEDPTFPLPEHNGEKIRLGMDVADVDNDGDLDVAYAVHMLFDNFGQPASQTLLYLNQGGAQGGSIGSFALDSTFMHAPTIAADVTFLDYDTDGDLDLYVINSGDLLGGPPEDYLIRNDL